MEACSGAGSMMPLSASAIGAGGPASAVLPSASVTDIGGTSSVAGTISPRVSGAVCDPSVAGVAAAKLACVGTARALWKTSPVPVEVRERGDLPGVRDRRRGTPITSSMKEDIAMVKRR